MPPRWPAELPGVVVRTTVVLDRCTDGSGGGRGDVRRRHGGRRRRQRRRGPGGRRRPGGRRSPTADPPERVLVASTDADCVVPELWLVDLHALAEAGYDLVVGAVHPDPADLSLRVVERWRDRHRRPAGHVHGANLAFTLAAYARAGGLQPVGLHEDVLLVDAMRAAGCRWTTSTSVRTSGRTSSRVAGGFATYLAGLVAQAE